ncbi:MAG TPA: glycogen debranching enzyme GlgX, partial [Beijerinckiaceae bacterium]
NGRCFGVLLDGRAQETGVRRPGADSTLLMVFNAHHDVVPFTLPEAVGGSSWVRLVDTNIDLDQELAETATGETYEVTGRSLLLFILKPARGKTTAAVRSFAHVIDAVEEAMRERVKLPLRD